MGLPDGYEGLPFANVFKTSMPLRKRIQNQGVGEKFNCCIFLQQFKMKAGAP